MSSSHLSALKSRHTEIDYKITREERRPSPDAGLIAQLKRQKLKLKEAMQII